jgi:hypothetical protein
MLRGRPKERERPMTNRGRRESAEANYAGFGLSSTSRGRPNVKVQPMSNEERRNNAAKNYNNARLLHRPPNGPLLNMFYRSEHARLRDNYGEVHNAESLGALRKSEELNQYESAQPSKYKQYISNLEIRKLHNSLLLNEIKALKLKGSSAERRTSKGSSATRRKSNGSSATRRNNAGSNGSSAERRNNAGSLNGSSAERRNKAGSF